MSLASAGIAQRHALMSTESYSKFVSLDGRSGAAGIVLLHAFVEDSQIRFL